MKENRSDNNERNASKIQKIYESLRYCHMIYKAVEGYRIKENLILFTFCSRTSENLFTQAELS